MNLRESQPYIIGWIRDYLSQVLAGALTILRLVVTDLTVIGQVVGSLKVAGDVHTVPLTSINAAQVGGFSAFNSVRILYKKVGASVDVYFHIYGTLSAATPYLDMPFTNVDVLRYVPIVTYQGGGLLDAGLCSLPANGSRVYFYKDLQGNPYTVGASVYLSGLLRFEASS